MAVLPLEAPEPVWNVDTGADGSLMWTTGSGAVVVVERGRAGSTVRRLDVATGVPMWEVPVDLIGRHLLPRVLDAGDSALLVDIVVASLSTDRRG